MPPTDDYQDYENIVYLNETRIKINNQYKKEPTPN